MSSTSSVGYETRNEAPVLLSRHCKVSRECGPQPAHRLSAVGWENQAFVARPENDARHTIRNHHSSGPGREGGGRRRRDRRLRFRNVLDIRTCEQKQSSSGGGNAKPERKPIQTRRLAARQNSGRWRIRQRPLHPGHQFLRRRRGAQLFQFRFQFREIIHGS